MRWLALVFVALIVALQYPMWLGKGGWLQVRELDRQLAAQKEANAKLKARNDALDADVRDLKTGSEAIEERARSELGMVKQDEVFFQLRQRPESVRGETPGGKAVAAAARRRCRSGRRAARRKALSERALARRGERTPITSRRTPRAARHLAPQSAAARSGGAHRVVARAAQDRASACSKASISSRPTSQRHGAPETLIVTDEALADPGGPRRWPNAIRQRTLVVPESLFAATASLPASVGVLAVVATPRPASLRLADFCLLVDDVQDPGNVGSMLRSAAAAGVAQVLLSKHCAFAWSPKVLRAGQGAHFCVDIHEDVDLPAWARGVSRERRRGRRDRRRRRHVALRGAARRRGSRSPSATKARALARRSRRRRRSA